MKTITQEQYLQLLGLMTLARRYNKKIQDLAEAAVDITRETDHEGNLDTMGHTYDACWSGSADVDDLLRKLDITVEKGEGE